MKEAARYAKIVEWSDEDQCFIGSCPGLFYGGCHGADERKVFAKLCELVEETIKLYQSEGRPLPPPTAGKDYVNRMLSAGRDPRRENGIGRSHEKASRPALGNDHAGI